MPDSWWKGSRKNTIEKAFFDTVSSPFIQQVNLTVTPLIKEVCGLSFRWIQKGFTVEPPRNDLGGEFSVK